MSDLLLLGPTQQERLAAKRDVLRLVKEICCAPAAKISYTLATISANSEPGQLHTLNLRETQDHTNVLINKDLSHNHRQKLIDLCERYKPIFSDAPSPANIPPCIIRLADTEPVRSRPYAIPHHSKEKVVRELEKIENAGFLEPSESPYASPMVIL